MADYNRPKLLSTLPRYDGNGMWRLHEEALEVWRALNPVADAPHPWQKNAILFSLVGSAAERVSVVGRGTDAFTNAADWAAYMTLVRNLFQPVADSEISRIAFRSRKQDPREDVGSYLTAKAALWRAAYPDDAQRSFNTLLDEAINGLANKVIKRMVRRAVPADEQELMAAATGAVASERYAYAGGYSESTSMDGLTTVIETAHRRNYPQRMDDVEPMEVDAMDRGDREQQKCYNCGIRGHLSRLSQTQEKERGEGQELKKVLQLPCPRPSGQRL